MEALSKEAREINARIENKTATLDEYDNGNDTADDVAKKLGSSDNPKIKAAIDEYN